MADGGSTLREALAEALLGMPISYISCIIPSVNDVVENGRYEIGVAIVQRSVEVSHNILVGF